MKLLKNSQYNELINNSKAFKNDYQRLESSYIKDTNYLENKIERINEKLHDLIQIKKSNVSKDKIYHKINEIILFIEKGKE